MSYDLVFWRGGDGVPADEVWEGLHERDHVDFLEEIDAAAIEKAFRDEYGKGMRSQAGLIEGPRFDVGFGPTQQYLQVSCAWAIVSLPKEIERIVRVGHALGCRVFDPQVGNYVAGDAPTPADLANAAAIRRAGAEAAQRAGLLPVLDAKSFEVLMTPAPAPLEPSVFGERCTSVEGARTWTLESGAERPAEAQPALDALAAFVVDAAANIFARGHSGHPRLRTSDVQTYVVLEQPVIPWPVLVSHISWPAAGEGAWSSRRLLSVVDGRVGRLVVPTERFTDDGETGERVTEMSCAFVQSSASARRLAESPDASLTAAIAASGEAAIEGAHAGDARALRRWIVSLVALANAGHGVVEALPTDAPSLAPFELHDSGAALPVWMQRPGGADYAEARIVFRGRGRFALTLISRGRAPQTFALPRLLGMD